jgi:hypothetical protein
MYDSAWHLRYHPLRNRVGKNGEIYQVDYGYAIFSLLSLTPRRAARRIQYFAHFGEDSARNGFNAVAHAFPSAPQAFDGVPVQPLNIDDVEVLADRFCRPSGTLDVNPTNDPHDERENPDSETN